MELLGALAVGLAAGFGCFLLFSSRFFPSEKRLEKPKETLDANVSDRMATAAKVVSELVPLSRTRERSLRAQIAAAGLAMRPVTFYGLSIILSVLGVLAVLLMLPYFAGSDPTVRFVAIIGAIALAIAGPRMYLHQKKTLRQEAINNQLSGVIDLLAISVEAGLTMERSMRHVSERMEGVLSEEIAKCERDINLLGYSRDDSLRRFADRCQTEGVSMFVSSVIISSKSGASISRVLKMQAKVARDRQHNRIEAKASKIATKMLFPMSMFMMPSLMIMVLAPAVLTMVNSLGFLL